jgi:ATP-dependent DNA helicase RecG
MDRQELIRRLQGFEWNDIEFKRARRGVPEDAYKTVSAFANTSGGYLVFGIQESSGGYEVSGVEDVDRVQNDFLSCLRAGTKFNRPIGVEESHTDIEGKTVLVFRILSVERHERPVYLNGDIRHSYIRRGGGDEKCNQREIERFLRDAGTAPYDADLLDLDAKDFYDANSLQWYRKRFDEREPGRHETLDDLAFLKEWGFLVERDGRCLPTRAALLLFGKARLIRIHLSRPVADFQIISASIDQWDPERRWEDRIVIEENLIQAWLAIVERYMKHADRPFEIDAATLRRHDAPPDYIAFREAAINLLVHQDYGDTGRHAQIQMFLNGARFWNPGDAFASVDELLSPGPKELRNPNLVGAFRRIGLSDQAGTGIRAMVHNWHRMGNVPPEIRNLRESQAFEVILKRERLLTPLQERFVSELGVHLDEKEADVFAYACSRERVTVTDIRALGGFSVAEAQGTLEHLVVQNLLQPLERGKVYALAPHLKPRYAELSSDSASEAESGQESRQESGLESRILNSLKKADLSKKQIYLDLGHKSVSGAMNRAIARLMERGVIEYTIPEKPNSRLQKYRLTEQGRRELKGKGEADG